MARTEFERVLGGGLSRAIRRDRLKRREAID
jgi:hypothetical protein